MEIDEYIAHLDAAFLRQKKRAPEFIEYYNRDLPIDECPNCKSKIGHLPGLPCCECSYTHPIPWALIRSSDTGWEVISIDNPRTVIMRFDVEED